MRSSSLFDRLRGGLIVSCQALPEEPLHSSAIMGRMAYAAMRGGAVGIRANTVADIRQIQQEVSLPILGIIKRVTEGCPVVITPTMAEVDALVACGVDLLAMDATDRPRPDGRSIADLFAEVRAKYPEQCFMADISTLEEGLRAEAMGFDAVGTTLCGYTAATQGRSLPDYDVIRGLAARLRVPLIAEGGIWTPEQLRQALDAGAHCAVVGTAITRPMDITRHFVAALEKHGTDA